MAPGKALTDGLDIGSSRNGAATLRSVLIVEDNYLLLDLLSSLCEQQGIRVLAASSGEAALTMLRKHGAEIDWLFTDISLPGLLDGWDVAGAYRAFHPHRPVIYTSTAARIAQRSVPGSVFVHKPFQVREILALARMMATGVVEEIPALSATG